jgi:hypothetical protein
MPIEPSRLHNNIEDGAGVALVALRLRSGGERPASSSTRTVL